MGRTFGSTFVSVESDSASLETKCTVTRTHNVNM